MTDPMNYDLEEQVEDLEEQVEDLQQKYHRMRDERNARAGHAEQYKKALHETQRECTGLKEQLRASRTLQESQALVRELFRRVRATEVAFPPKLLEHCDGNMAEAVIMLTQWAGRGYAEFMGIIQTGAGR